MTNFKSDNSIVWGCEKEIWAGGRRKLNATEGCGPSKVILLCNFIKITIRYKCSPANLLHIFRTIFV